MKTILDALSARIEAILTYSNEQKKTKIFQKIIRQTAYANTPFLKYHLGHGLNTGIMFLLQFISFFTTFAGARYYLFGINSFAPIFFAFAIQLGLLYYATAFSNAVGKKGTTFVLLSIFTLTSIIFSYSGMAIACLPPEDEYKKAYEAYATEFEIVKSNLLEENLTEEDVPLKVNEFLGHIDATILKAESEINSLSVAIDSKQAYIEGQKHETSYTTSDPNTGVTSTSTGAVFGTTEDTAKSKSELEELRILLKEHCETLVVAKSNLSADMLTAYITQDPSKYSGEYDISNKIIKVIESYNSLISELYTDNSNYEKVDYSTNYFDELRKKLKNSHEISNITLDADIFESTANSELSNLENSLKSLLATEFSADSARKTLEFLQLAVSENFIQIQSCCETMADGSIDLSKLISAKETIDKFGDPNVQILSYIVNREYTSKIIGVLLLAILVDMLTFILGIFGTKKKLALLALDTSKELIENEEQLFSIVFIALIGSKTPDILKNVSIEEFEHKCMEYVNGIKQEIVAFLSCFEVSPCTGDLGYSLFANYDTLKGHPNHTPIISILHQLDYLKFLSKQDFQLLVKRFRGIPLPDEDSPGTQPVTDAESNDYICLLRCRAELYLYSSNAEVSTMFIQGTINSTASSTIDEATYAEA